jgi:UDP-N-acetylmuramoyl-L-alanyl-D-glutamate--2,6-diaminopimelate ligase
MVALKDILTVLDNPEAQGDLSVQVTGVTHDSRQVRQGWIFVAIPGFMSDGHDFIGKAVTAGAAAILAERPRTAEFGSTPWIKIANTRQALGAASAIVYGTPTEAMTLIGITGTNGKTTLTYLLEAIIKAAGGTPGVVGTVTHRWGGNERPAANTTPESSDLQSMFRAMVDDGVSHVLLEASSQGLDLGRLDGCQFDVGVFTNLTQDHLDYHRDLETYYLAKRILFERLLPSSTKRQRQAVINTDDPYGRRLAQEITELPVVRFGTDPGCDVHPREISVSAEGISGKLRTPTGVISVRSRLTGSFNLLNILAAVAVANTLGVPDQSVSEGIEALEVIPGRLERVPSEKGLIFVDYAHTPGALKNVLDALQAIRSNRIITVMGCGGDRDKQKRPIMGSEAASGSDFVIITSDNPRTEEPLTIIRQVEQGVTQHGFLPYPEGKAEEPFRPGSYHIVLDRRQAISWALQWIENGDILLVAGKGHETYQEINGVRYPFDDREVLRDELQRRSGASIRGIASDRTDDGVQVNTESKEPADAS